VKTSVLPQTIVWLAHLPVLAGDKTSVLAGSLTSLYFHHTGWSPILGVRRPGGKTERTSLMGLAPASLAGLLTWGSVTQEYVLTSSSLAWSAYWPNETPKCKTTVEHRTLSGRSLPVFWGRRDTVKPQTTVWPATAGLKTHTWVQDIGLGWFTYQSLHFTLRVTDIGLYALSQGIRVGARLPHLLADRPKRLSQSFASSDRMLSHGRKRCVQRPACLPGTANCLMANASGRQAPMTSELTAARGIRP
jgi:hypothetical protein